MNSTLYTLLTDPRLYDLFGDNDNLTVSQLWVLEIEREGVSERRFLYGRSLPGTFQSDRWSGTVSSKTQLDESISIKTHALTVLTSAKKLKLFIEHFTNGSTLEKASLLSGLSINDKLANSVGNCKFGENCIIRPVMHLPTRDYYRFKSRHLSPTSFCSVDSAAILSEGKPRVFSTPEGYDKAIAEAAFQALDADTGLEFSGIDAWRIGDFELICAPGLNTAERRKYEIYLKGPQSSLTLFEPLTREPSDLLVIIKLFSDDSTQFSYITTLNKNASYPLHHTFEINAIQNQACTAYTMEIYTPGINGEPSFLLLQIGAHFLREMHLNTQIMDSIRATDQFTWLAKKVPKKEKARLEAAGYIGRAVTPSRSTMGGNMRDPWVPLNRLIQNRVEQLHPRKSDGQFFPTLNNSNGMSRLELKDWLKNIFERHHDARIAWIDPYMEDVGIDLLNRLGTTRADYLIITTERISNNVCTKLNGQHSRIEKLLARCSDWNNGYYGSVRLKVLAVPESKLHDRMILIRSANGQPLAGYHLSNSIQRASENHPLLATPIPLDVMPHVFEYIDQIIQSTLHSDGKTQPPANIVFNSDEIEAREEDQRKDLIHHKSFDEPPYAGYVLAWWLDDDQLSGLSGAALMEQMGAKGYVKEGRLDPERFDSLPAKFWTDGLSFADFSSAWDALGYVIAHSPASRYAGGFYNKEQPLLSPHVTLALLEHISPSRANALPPRHTKAQLDIEYYRSQALTTLLLSKTDPFDIFQYSPVGTSWSDYYAIKLLWSHAPKQLISWLDAILSKPIEYPRSHALVVETLKHICLCVSFDKHHEEIDALLQSKASIIVWIGLHALESAINKGDWEIETLSKIDYIESATVRRTILCWLINEANFLNSAAKPQLINALTQSLNAPLTDEELKNILQPVRGRLGRLHHFTPWILESMLIPMLEQKTIDISQVARHWLTELLTQWRSALKNDSIGFTPEADGAFTDELAAVTRYLSSGDQEYILKELRKVFDALARNIRLPLGAQRDWKAFSNAHQVNLWLYALARKISALEPSEPLSWKELILESEEIIERIQPSHCNWLSRNQLLTYVKGDPEQIRDHSLHQIIQRAIAPQ